VQLVIAALLRSLSKRITAVRLEETRQQRWLNPTQMIVNSLGSIRPGRTPQTGHPSVEQLVAQQGTGPVTDVNVLRGDFWPEEESIDEFLATLHEWRGHVRTDPAA